MIFVRVRDRVGHEFSTPIDDPLIEKGLLRVVDRKGMTHLPLPPKFKKTLPPLGGIENEEAING